KIWDFALLVEEGRTRLRRGQVVLRRFELHHPVAARHPSSTGRGMRLNLPSSWRRAGRDCVADRWSYGASNPPPRRCAPPLLDEEGNVLRHCPPVKEGRTLQCRGQVVLPRFELHHPVAARHPSSTRRGTFWDLPSSWRRAGRDNVA